jgi:hypothetical protein
VFALFSIFAIFSATDIGLAEDVFCFVASTWTIGSLVAVSEGVAACEIGAPPGAHINSAIDELATAIAHKDLMAMSSQFREANSTLESKDITSRMRIGPLSISETPD